MVEGCQGMYNQLLKLGGAHNGLNQATVVLAQKSKNMAGQVNTNSQGISKTQQALGEVQKHVARVD